MTPADVDEVILGHVLQAATGQGPARQASMGAGIPKETPAWSLNQICGSGLRAVALGYQQIAMGDAKVIVAGGQESMSQAPHAQHLRNGHKMGDLAFTDTMIKDGLWDAFNGYHMGQTAENIAEKFQISRADQDAFALASQHKAEAAQKRGPFRRGDRPGRDPGPQGRRHRRQGRIHPSRRDPGSDGEAEARLHQGGVGHGGQCLGPQRRRRGPGADVGG